jgi:hypothetical protein
MSVGFRTLLIRPAGPAHPHGTSQLKTGVRAPPTLPGRAIVDGFGKAPSYQDLVAYQEGASGDRDGLGHYEAPVPAQPASGPRRFRAVRMASPGHGFERRSIAFTVPSGSGPP